MTHQERESKLVELIVEIMQRYQWEFNTSETRLKICSDLKNFFMIAFDDYWQESTGIKPENLDFVDLTTNSNINNNSYSIGVSINGQPPILFSKFLTLIRIDSIRNTKIEEILS